MGHALPIRNQRREAMLEENVRFIEGKIGRSLKVCELRKISDAMSWGLMNPIDLARHIGLGEIAP